MDVKIKTTIQVSIVLLGIFMTSLCMIDVNVHQLQWIADHLEEIECRKLADALHQNTFELLKPVDGEHEPNKSCIYLLLKWDRTEGKGKTFNTLALRLGQIDRQDLADKLSKLVHDEKSETLERRFLDDPFKKTVPKKSFFLSQKEHVRQSPGEDVYKSLTGWEIFGIVCGAVTCLSVITFVVCYLFGSVISKCFRRYAPDFMVTWFDLVRGQCKWFCKNTKRTYDKEVIGSKKKDRKYVMDLNRNLNNYLNGHLEDAFYYFKET